jgi:Sulfotransferase family
MTNSMTTSRTAGRPPRAPIVITGLPRSGTSWVGKMLEASGRTVYVNEPMNPHHPPGHTPGVLNVDVERAFQYICTANEGPYLPAFADTARLRYHPLAELRRNQGAYDLARLVKYGASFTRGRITKKRALLDDPYAVFSARWLADRMGATVVILVRDPVAFCGSWHKLGWTTYFHELLEQPHLVQDLLGDHVPELQRLVGSTDKLAKNATLWRATYDVVGRWSEVPGVHIRRYEDFSRAPVESFHELYDVCGLPWSAQTEATVVSGSQAGPQSQQSYAWNLSGGASRTAFKPMDSTQALNSFRDRLDEAQIGRIREMTAEVSSRFYPEVAVEQTR